MARLTPDELAIIAAADADESTASLAQRLGREYSTVRRARSRLADPAATRAKLATAKARQRERHQATYTREIERTRQRRDTTPPEQRDREHARHRRYEVTRNEQSKRHASNHYRLWTAEEEQIIRDTMRDPVPEVARTLGRSIAATNKRRHYLRRHAEQDTT